MASKIEHVIIVGASRAGSTSLFNYLADHPVICGSYVKQTLFFIDKDYRGVISQPIFHYLTTPKQYDSFFKNYKIGQLKLEASPDYLYSLGTAAAIKAQLGDKVHLIFLFRNPVERHVSLFYHAKQTKLISEDTTLKDFLEKSLNEEDNTDFYGKFMLPTGKYYDALESYLQHFPREQMTFLFTEHLKEQPKEVLSMLCRRLGLNSSFYDKYEFQIHNKKQVTKYKFIFQLYAGLRKFGLRLMGYSRFLQSVLAVPKKIVSLLYKKINTKPVTNQHINKEQLLGIQNYFAKDTAELMKFMNQTNPWK